MAAFRHPFEKVGRHRARQRRPSAGAGWHGGAAVGRGRGAPFGDVDVLGRSKAELLELARRVGVRGRSRMSKVELSRALARVR